MDLLLSKEAIRAQDIAEILSTIRNFDHERVQEITLAITALNNLGWALRDLSHQLVVVRGITSSTFTEDLCLVHNSVASTLQDIWAILGKIRRDAIRIDYHDAWTEVRRYCSAMGKQTLHMRLDTYNLFLVGLCKVLRR
jgi:hypothetical protein